MKLRIEFPGSRTLAKLETLLTDLGCSYTVHIEGTDSHIYAMYVGTKADMEDAIEAEEIEEVTVYAA